MNLVSALFLVVLLATSAYAAGRLHGQVGYRLGFRSGYRQGFGDGDRAACLYRRRERSTRNAGPVLARATAAPPAVTAAPPAVTARAPAVAAVAPPTAAAPRVASVSAPAGGAVATRQHLGRPGGSPTVRPTNRGVGMRGTMYHSTGALALRGGRHAHPE